MLPIPNNEENRKLSIRMAFNAKLSSKAAIEFAVQSFPSISKNEEVIKWYEEFAEEKRDIIKKELMSATEEPSLLETIPVEVLEKIFVDSTTKDQEALQKTNSNISDFISEKFEVYETIKVYMTRQEISMSVKKEDEMCAVLQRKRRKLTNEAVIMPGNTTPEILGHLQRIFQTPNVKIQELAIEFDMDEFPNEEKREEFHTGLLAMISDLKWKLHVEEFSFPVKDQNSLMTMINGMKIGVLRELYIKHYHSRFPSRPAISTDAIVSSEHWPHLQRLITLQELDIPPVKIAHIRSVSIDMVVPVVEDLVTYTKTLLDESKKMSHKLCLTNFDANEYMEALKPFSPKYDMGKKGGTLMCNNNKKITFEISRSQLSFVSDDYWKLTLPDFFK